MMDFVQQNLEEDLLEQKWELDGFQEELSNGYFISTSIY